MEDEVKLKPGRHRKTGEVLKNPPVIKELVDDAKPG